MQAKKSVGIWVRVSTGLQGDSPEHHQKRAEYYAAAKSWEVKRVYLLDAVSGKSVIGLPEWKQMIEDVQNGTITGLIFSKLARVARNTKELLDLADAFKELGADLISLEESLDTSTPAGRFFYTLVAAMAQWEREEIASRVAASVPIRAKLGKPLGGAAIFGYRWEGKELIIDEKEAPIRKLVYELFLKYKRKKTVASELNKMGHRTRNGSLFSDTTIDRLLKDPTAKGHRIANYTKSLGEGKKWVVKPKDEWVITPCRPIIAENIWNECNHILVEQERKRRKPGPRVSHLLAGLVTCNCGNKMYVFHNSSRKYSCKKCKNKIEVAILDEVYKDELQRFLLQHTDIDAHREQSETLIEEKKSLFEQTKAEFQKLGKRMSELVNLRVDGELTKEIFQKEYKPMEERYIQLEQQLPELEAELDFLKIQSLSSETLIDNAVSLNEKWPTLSFEEKRSIVETITDKITIGNSDIHLELSFTPSPRNPSSSPNDGNRQHNLKDS